MTSQKFQNGFKNDSFLKAIAHQPTPYTPMWLMRQAGRYLDEYRATRAKAGSFLSLCQTPELACEVTLQPIDRFGFDAAILFSDILTVPDAMGLGLEFVEGEGPRFKKPVRDEQAVFALSALTEDAVNTKLAYVTNAIKTITQALDRSIPLIGFSGSPWTLACYMVEGQGSDDFRLVKTMLYSRPDLMKHLIEINTHSVLAYLNAQIDAGVDVVMIFDTWGGILPDGVYQSVSLAAMKQVLKQLKPNPITGKPIPSILFTKGGGIWIDDLIRSGASMIGLDWTIALNRASAQIKTSGLPVALQGNLDPMVLMGDPKQARGSIRDAVERMMQTDFNGLGHVFNLGHGISQYTPVANVETLVEAVREFSRR